MIFRAPKWKSPPVPGGTESAGMGRDAGSDVTRDGRSVAGTPSGDKGLDMSEAKRPRIKKARSSRSKVHTRSVSSSRVRSPNRLFRSRRSIRIGGDTPASRAIFTIRSWGRSINIEIRDEELRNRTYIGRPEPERTTCQQKPASAVRITHLPKGVLPVQGPNDRPKKKSKETGDLEEDVEETGLYRSRSRSQADKKAELDAKQIGCSFGNQNPQLTCFQRTRCQRAPSNRIEDSRRARG